MAKKNTKGDDRMVAVEEALGRSEQFIEKNQNILMYAIIGIVVIVLGYFGYQKFIVAPKEVAAQEQIYMAQKYFDIDSLSRALYGDGNALGFLDIADDYGSSKTGNLAKYYAGICFLKMGNYEEAIEYLESYDPVDQIVGPMAIGALGDAHMELGETEKAASYYMKAANENINDFTTPLFLFKAGMTYELLEEYDKAFDAYDRIYREFYRSNEGRVVERNIARVKQLSGN
jgi:tetratricopeptide (TPR) repeat protein